MKFEDLMKKKKEEGRGMPDHEMEAKKSVLEHVRQLAQDMMKGKLDEGMKKVSVSSDSKEGLKEGLEHAKHLIGDSSAEGASEGEGSEEQEGEEDMEASDDDGAESPLHLGAEHAEEEAGEREQDGLGGEDEEAELDRKLAELMAQKKRLEAKRS